MKAPQRSKSLQIYMKPGIREDDLLLDVWEACAQFDRPQDVFRTMLRRGLRAMVESGDMPKAVRDACDLDAVMEKRRGRARHDPAPQPPAYPYPPQPPYQPYPSQTYAPYPQPYSPQPENGQWRGDEPRPRFHEHDLDPPPLEQRRPLSHEDRRPIEYDRRASEEKAPNEPPRPQPSPVQEKRPEQAVAAPDPPKPQGSGATYGKGKKLGNIM